MISKLFGTEHKNAIINTLRKFTYLGDKTGYSGCSFDELKHYIQKNYGLDCSGNLGIDRAGVFIDADSNISFIQAFISLYKCKRVMIKNASLGYWLSSGRPMKVLNESTQWIPTLIEYRILPEDLALFEVWDTEAKK